MGICWQSPSRAHRRHIGAAMESSAQSSAISAAGSAVPQVPTRRCPGGHVALPHAQQTSLAKYCSGPQVGAAVVGVEVGAADGMADGVPLDGTWVGEDDGVDAVGSAVGAAVGARVGEGDGASVGPGVGPGVGVGVGDGVGDGVGSRVGTGVGAWVQHRSQRAGQAFAISSVTESQFRLAHHEGSKSPWQDGGSPVPPPPPPPGMHARHSTGHCARSSGYRSQFKGSTVASSRHPASSCWPLQRASR